MENRLFAPIIPDENMPCKLELELPTLTGNALCIPFGFSETQLQSKPKPEDQVPNFVAVIPKVFKEPTLDKNKAGYPEFVAMRADQDALLATEAIGYYYIFIDGFLWREIAALPNGDLSEVDLAEYHDKDVRPFSSLAAKEIVFPSRSIGLLNENKTLTNPIIEIAFSRIQWSWEYVIALGGMYQKDERFNLSPALSRCDDAGLATQLRQKRMQTIDLSSAPDYENIENMGVVNGEACVYVHDLLGIAQDIATDAAAALAMLKQNQNALESDGYYKSAILAHRYYFDEELHEMERYHEIRVGIRERYKNRDGQSKDLRDIAEDLCRYKLEKYLIGEEPEAVCDILEAYTKARATLINIFKQEVVSDNAITPFSDCCSQQNVQPPPAWEVATVDFTSLSLLNYTHAFELLYNMLNMHLLPMAATPVYLPAITNKEKRDNITASIKAVIADGQAIISSLMKNKKSWVYTQLMAPEGLYGEDGSKNEPDKSKLLTSIGAYSPEKLDDKKVSQAAMESEYFPDPIFPYLHTSDTIKRGINELLNYYTRVFKNAVDSAEQVKPTILFQFFATAKSYLPDMMEGSRIGTIGQVDKDHVLINYSVTEHSFRGLIKTKEANKAVINSIKNIREGKSINKGHVVTLYHHIWKNNPSVAFSKAPSAYDAILPQTRAEIESILHELADRNILYDDVYVKKIPGIIVPRNKIPQSEAKTLGNVFYDDGVERALRVTDLKSLVHTSQYAISSIFAGIAAINAIYTYAIYEQSFGGKSGGYQTFKHLATLGSVIAATGELWDLYAQKGEAHPLTKARATEIAKTFRRRKNTAKFTILRSFSGGVGAVTGGLQIVDGLSLASKHDKDAAIASIIAGGLSISSAIYSAIYLSAGPIGWALFLGAISMSIIATMLTDTQGELWAKHSPFAKDEPNNNNLTNNLKKSDTLYKYLCSLLFSPSVSLTCVKGSYFIAEVSLPHFQKGVSSISVRITYDTWDTATNIYKAGQPIITHYEREVVLANAKKDYTPVYNEHNQLTAAQFHFEINTPKTFLLDNVQVTPTYVHNNELTLPIDYTLYD
ncbi:hypothetical protein [Flocculibacter collagenilyticus]|uniref:hypothetical protein n=1 Tax=Flocculibacter collagenilyticus TaxID=2744479 RepID=UPI0018F44087|nr:hypothetical protein [Flocculibacter collagenilyticus]